MRVRSPLNSKLLLGNKLVLASVTMAATAIVGTAGFAAAQAGNGNSASGTPAIVAKCKQEFKQLGFKNQGQCVSSLVHQEHGYGGNGSGSNNTVNARVDVNVKGNNNVIDTVMSFVFG